MRPWVACHQAPATLSSLPGLERRCSRRSSGGLQGSKAYRELGPQPGGRLLLGWFWQSQRPAAPSPGPHKASVAIRQPHLRSTANGECGGSARGLARSSHRHDRSPRQPSGVGPVPAPAGWQSRATSSTGRSTTNLTCHRSDRPCGSRCRCPVCRRMPTAGRPVAGGPSPAAPRFRRTRLRASRDGQHRQSISFRHRHQQGGGGQRRAEGHLDD